MNLLRISSAFDIINESQAQIDYAFEPRILSPQTKNYKKPGNSEIDTSAYEVFSDNLKNICY